MDAERGERFRYPREVMLPDGRRLHLYENPPLGWFAGVWERHPTVAGCWTAKGWAERAPSHAELWDKVKRRLPVDDPRLLSSTVDGTFAGGPSETAKKLQRRPEKPKGGPNHGPVELWAQRGSVAHQRTRRAMLAFLRDESIPVTVEGPRLLVEIGGLPASIAIDFPDDIAIGVWRTVSGDGRQRSGTAAVSEYFETVEAAATFIRARQRLAAEEPAPTVPEAVDPPPSKGGTLKTATPAVTDESRQTWHRSWVRYLADERAATRARRMTPARERASVMVNVPPADAPLLYYPDSVRWGEPHRVLATGQPATVGWGVATGAGRQRDPVPSRFVAFLWLMGCGARVIAKIAGLSKSAADRRLQEITAEEPPTGHVRVTAAAIIEAWDPGGAAAGRREPTADEAALPQRLADAERTARDLVAAAQSETGRSARELSGEMSSALEKCKAHGSLYRWEPGIWHHTQPPGWWDAATPEVRTMGYRHTTIRALLARGLIQPWDRRSFDGPHGGIVVEVVPVEAP